MKRFGAILVGVGFFSWRPRVFKEDMRNAINSLSNFTLTSVKMIRSQLLATW